MPRKPHLRAARRPRHPVVLALVAAAAGTLLAPWPERAAAQATQAAEQAFDIDLPAQPLAQALAALSRQTGVQVFAAGELVSGRAAPAVRGRLTARQALDQVLAGSGLAGVEEGSTWVVRPRPTPSVASAPVLPAVTARATAGPRPGEPPKPYAGGQVAQGSRLGILGNTNIFETPFSTSSYTANLIQNQGARNLDEVVINNPSIRTSTAPGFVLDQFSIRGFPEANILFDGLPGFTGYSRLPAQNFERVEVFKGPTAALTGSLGGIGGTVNLLPKRATDLPVRTVTLGAYDKSLFAMQADIGQRFGVDNALGARLNAYAENGDLSNGTKRDWLAPQMALDYRGTDVRVLFDAGLQRYDDSKQGINWFMDPGAAVPRAPNPRTNPSFDWAGLELKQAYGLLTAEWDFAGGWTTYARAGRFEEEAKSRIFPNVSSLDRAGNFTIDGYYNDRFKTRGNTSELGMRGALSLGAVKHELVLSGLRASSHRFDANARTFLFAPVQSNLYDPVSVPDPTAGNSLGPERFDPSKSVQKALALADAMTLLDDRLRLLLAARRVSIKSGDYDQSRISPTVAALYKFDGGWSVYANYAQALSEGEIAPDNVANPFEPLRPYVSTQRELGLKWNAGRYGVTLAWFDIDQPFAFIDGSNVFRLGGEQRNRGVELETFGEPLTGVRLLGGIAYIDSEQTRTESGATDGKKAIGVPGLTVNLGLEHDLSAVPGLTLIARYVHTGSAYMDLVNEQRVEAWNRIDVGARYATRVAGQPLNLRVGVNNLLNRDYWTTGGRNVYVVAPPRVWNVSATLAF